MMSIYSLKRSTEVAILDAKRVVPKTVIGTSPVTLSDSVNGFITSINIKGHSKVVSGSIKSVGDDGFTITTVNSDNTETSTATLTTGLPLRSVSDSIYDTLDNVKVVKKCAEVDLGNLTWEKDQREGFAIFVGAIADIKLPDVPADRLTGLICSGYELSTKLAYAEMEDKSIMRNLATVVVKDSDYYNSDATAFKTAVTGVKLVYPLATPTETPLSSAEKAALTALETYEPTTIINATDNPYMTITYRAHNRLATPAPAKKRTSRKKKS